MKRVNINNPISDKLTSAAISRPAQTGRSVGSVSLKHSTSIKLSTWAIFLFALSTGSSSELATHQIPTIYVDGAGDVTIRRTDSDADAPIDPELLQPIDLVEIRIGKFSPYLPNEDVFDGVYGLLANFVRIELLFAGLVAPPGPATPESYYPYLYGNNPVYGFIEIDMDENVDTGGELEAARFRYLANVARFGGRPALDRFEDRVALSATDYEHDFYTPPYYRRHGEEFHIAFLGPRPDSPGYQIQIVAGDEDLLFEAGETWDLFYSWFHRAHGYEEFSFITGGDYPGQYAPSTKMRFTHDPISDMTTAILVYPINPAGAGEMLGEQPQPMDFRVDNHFCVLEALIDLQYSAAWEVQHPSGVVGAELLAGWENQNPTEHMYARNWQLTALFGTTYPLVGPINEVFIWTDAYPSPLVGDINGNGELDLADRAYVQNYIDTHDADDGVVDGLVAIPAFAFNFSICDFNYDGWVGNDDILGVDSPGDTDRDRDVDLYDAKNFQICFSGSTMPPVWPKCLALDLDSDGDVDLADYGLFFDFITGP